MRKNNSFNHRYLKNIIKNISLIKYLYRTYIGYLARFKESKKIESI